MQAHRDGPTLAVAKNPQPAQPPTASVDACRDLEIKQCTMKLRLLVAAGFALTLLSASLAFDWPAFDWTDSLGRYAKTIGYAGVALFGVVTGWLIWLLPTERGPVVIVTPFGIRDLRIGNEFLLWESIAEISVEERRGHRRIVLTPTPALQRQLRTMPSLARSARNERTVIQLEGLAADFDTVLRACRDCHAASHPRTALQQEDERGSQGFAVQAS
jgi:hypothetical protein